QHDARELTARILQQYVRAEAEQGSSSQAAGAREGQQGLTSQNGMPTSQSASGQGLTNQQAIQLVQREADFGRVLEQIQDMLRENEALSREAATTLGQALSEASHLHQQGRELAARGHLAQ